MSWHDVRAGRYVRSTVSNAKRCIPAWLATPSVGRSPAPALGYVGRLSAIAKPQNPGSRDFVASRSVRWSMGTSLSGGSPIASQPAVEDLYRDHAQAMYRVAVAVVQDHALAEDVVQDATMSAWQHIDSFRGESSWRTWLLRITHNSAVSTLRRLRDTATAPADIPEDATRDLATDAMDHAFVEAFERALFNLDSTSRTIVALRELEGLSYEEIAEVLDVSESVIKTRLFRARRNLADQLSDWRIR